MVKRIFYELKLQNIQGKVWTTDARYCETKAKLEARKAEFCEVSIVTVDQIIKDIAQLEYSLFVVNSYAAGIQQNDGRYITKYFPMSPFVIEQMLKRQGSMGCYQQGYRTNRIKWICFDFDCKEKVEPDVYDLYNQCIVPFTQMLDEFGIHYMMEFSGRRGIHVWITFNKLLTKELGFRIVCKLEQCCAALSEIKESKEWGLDRFPATNSSRNNIVGKQVKFPLSCHKSGTRSYFFTGNFQKKEDTESEQFLKEQLTILEGYEPNDVDEITHKLGVITSQTSDALLKYRKYCLVGKIEITVDQVVEILSETTVFNKIFLRMEQGLALPQDWTVLLGTLFLCDSNAQLVKDVFRRFPNYDEHKTCSNIEKIGGRYFPATFEYLYRIYGMTIESSLDGQETSLHYLLRRCGLEQNLLVQFEELNEKTAVSDIRITVNKEKAYLKDNDEVPDVSVWNRLCNLKQYDLQFYDALVGNIMRGEKIEYVPDGYKVYKRIESSDKIRTLVSLSAKDRVITTNLALRLCSGLKMNWKSFSYHVSYTSPEQIFYYWYSSWGRFIDHIRVFTEIPFMDNYEVFYIDLKGFYDHIDFVSVFRAFEDLLDEETKNIFIFLTEYNDKLMKQLQKGRRIGVPQGPAYARIIAEMFLDQLLESVCCQFNHRGFYMYRYVDDIVFFCKPDFDGRELYDNLTGALPSAGLPVNLEKSRYFGKISSLTDEEKRMLLHQDSFNYELKENEYTGILIEEERRRKLKNYLMKNSFNVGSLSYIFGKNTISEAQNWCLNYYRKDILKGCDGRGSNFRKFYEFLFRNERYMKKILDNQELLLINLDSLNFSNFIHTLYYAVQNHVIAPSIFERIKYEYLEKLTDTELKEDDRVIVKALKLINAEVSNEKI